MGSAEDSTIELDGVTNELDAAIDDWDTAELAVIVLDDGITDADEGSDEAVAGAEELSGLDVAVSEGATEDAVTEEATYDDDAVEASKEEAISEENVSASDDGTADLGLAIDLHRLVTPPCPTHEVIENSGDENENKSGERKELVNSSLIGDEGVVDKGADQGMGCLSMK